jgi:hypothetical protein
MRKIHLFFLSWLIIIAFASFHGLQMAVDTLGEESAVNYSAWAGGFAIKVFTIFFLWAVVVGVLWIVKIIKKVTNSSVVKSNDQTIKKPQEKVANLIPSEFLMTVAKDNIYMNYDVDRIYKNDSLSEKPCVRFANGEDVDSDSEPNRSHVLSQSHISDKPKSVSYCQTSISNSFGNFISYCPKTFACIVLIASFLIVSGMYIAEEYIYINKVNRVDECSIGERVLRTVILDKLKNDATQEERTILYKHYTSNQNEDKTKLTSKAVQLEYGIRPEIWKLFVEYVTWDWESEKISKKQLLAVLRDSP